MQKINKWDRVIVISGKDKWTVSEVLSVKRRDPIRGNLILVSKVNIVKKHTKEWIVEKEMHIHVSNVMIYLDEKKSRVWIRFNKKGKKERFSKKLGKTL